MPQPLTIYIPGNVPSSKNGKQWTGRFLVINKTVKEYVDGTKNYFQHHRASFLWAIAEREPPYRISFKFVRDSKRKFDYANALQTVQDMMTGGFKKNKFEDTSHRTWIEDDNADILIPVFEPYEYKKNQGGVYITLL